MAAKGETGIILILSRESDIPSFITTVVRVGTAQRAGLDDKSRNAILSLPEASGDYHAEVVAELRNVSISYGGRKILDGVDWKIRNGEKWALCGRNGCGKSTLLSLICADNPQAYACDITLFDRKRGSGESIWDIKKHIGYVSPEMYRAYLQHVPAGEIVASGFTDIVGICRKPDPEQLSSARFWMNIFGIGDLEDRYFTELSSGEQHLCLLARAFVKDPDLIIYNGYDEMAICGFSLGCDGAIGSTYNVLAPLMIALRNLCDANDYHKALEIQTIINGFISDMCKGNKLFAVLKYIISNTEHINFGTCRKPFKSLTYDEELECDNLIERLMEAVN